jgi:hypothetical protein
MPPMSTTSLPSTSERLPSSRPAPITPPILASDILREEIAPLAPARATLRLLVLPLAVGFAVWAALSLFGVTTAAPLEATGALIAACAGLAALLGGPYAARAGLATLAGLVPLVLGASGQGPLASMALEGSLVTGAGLVLVTVLPASLFFRSQYRAFGAARGLLAVALLLAVPTLYFLSVGALSVDLPPLTRALDALAATAVLTSLGGFLGPETTGACTAWGILILATFAARTVAVVWAAPQSPGPASALAAGLGVGVSGAVASVGLHQLLAALFARRARKADIHKILGPSAEEEP